MRQPDVIHAADTIRAPLERVFALSTRIELVKTTLGMNLVTLTAEEEAQGYLRSGHVVANSRVHWYGWKFGLPTHHHTLITQYVAPHTDAAGVATAFFEDMQAKGRFAFFQHDHGFREALDPASGSIVTHLEDTVRYALPFGPLGRLAGKLLLGPHIERLVHVRYGILRDLAEGEGWRNWVDTAAR